MVQDGSGYFHILQTEQFTKLSHDPTKSFENKIQQEIRKLKTRLPVQEYHHLYSIGLSPGRFYGTATFYRLAANATIEELPIRPIVSNIGTASHCLAKHLSKNLSPLGQSTYSIKSNYDLSGKIKNEQKLLVFTIASFYVKLLLTSVPFTETIDVILYCVYNCKEI